MPGILPMKLIKVGGNSSAQARIAQACDRCRSKKIKCGGQQPSCEQCSNVGFECKTSDKLSRRAFPRGYTESLEEKVRNLEAEIRELKDLLDAKDDKIDMLSKLYPSGVNRQTPSIRSYSDLRQPSPDDTSQSFKVHQSSLLHPDCMHEARYMGISSNPTLLNALKVKASEVGRSCPDIDYEVFASNSRVETSSPSRSSSPCDGPSRLLSDQMVNIYFQEFAPLFPCLHRPTFLSTYEQFVDGAASLSDTSALIQLQLVFGIATVSNKTRISYDTTPIELHWLKTMETLVETNSLSNLQCLLLAQIYCIQTGDWARVLRYRALGTAMALYLGMNQSQKRFALGVLACETRKKVFWSLYTLDCFISAQIGAPRSLHDQDCQCEAPIDVDDEYISDHGIQPVLPGEASKLSTALSLFGLSRIMAKVQGELYSTQATYDLSFNSISSLENELNAWCNSLPSHLRLQYMGEKPSTTVTSSRSPLLSLAYHYVRFLTHLPAAYFAPSEISSVSIVSLAASSKHIIQISQLLEERNMSFSFPVHKDSVLVMAMCGVMLQSLAAKPGSMLLRDCEKSTEAALDLLKNHAHTNQQRSLHSSMQLIENNIMCHEGPRRRSSVAQSDLDSPRSGKSGRRLSSSLNASQYSSAVNSTENLPNCTSASGPLSTTLDVGANNRRLRPLVPSLTDSATSYENVSSASSTAPMRRLPQRSHPNAMPSVNLDFYNFEQRPHYERDGRRALLKHGQQGAAEWERMLNSISNGHLSSSGVRNWTSQTSIPAMVVPHEEGREAQPFSNNDEWTFTTNIPQEYDGPPQLEPLKTGSLFSFSDDSLNSGEEFSNLDWSTTSGEGNDFLQAMIANLNPDEISEAFR